MMRVLVAGEIAFYREGLASHLEQHTDATVVGTATCADDTIDQVERLRPDVVLLDMVMRDSLVTVQAIAARHPAVRVVALAVCDVERDVLACAEAGIAGYVPRDASLADLVRTIECAVRGECILSPRMAAGLLRRVATLASAHTDRTDRAVDLTAREVEIVHCIERGLSNKEIAGRLVIEVATVKNHVHNVLDKLQVRRRGEVARRMRLDHRWLPTARDDLDLSLNRS